MKTISLFLLTLLLSSTLTVIMEIKTVKTENMIIVPDDYPTIQEAVNAASSGDTIFIKNGFHYMLPHYRGVLITTDYLKLVGESIENTHINGTIVIAADGVVLENFASDGSTGVAIYGNYNLIRRIRFFSNHEAITVIRSNFTMIEHCYIKGALLYSLKVRNFCHHTIFRNNFLEETARISVQVSPFTIIENNTLLGEAHYDGIFMSFADGSIIANNTLMKILSGIHISLSSNILVRGNSVIETSSSRRLVFELSYCSEFQIYGNNLTGNSVGLHLINCSNGLIHHNNFINNTKQVELEYSSNNVWDIDYPFGGNYWSNYNGSDLFSGVNQDVNGSDGIGDLPFNIDVSAMDSYPLMRPCQFTFLATDLSGDFWLGIDDIVVCAEAFGSDPFIHNIRWNPLCDVDHDGRVGIEDLLTIAQHFGESA